jgi:hypothetical protein
VLDPLNYGRAKILKSLCEKSRHMPNVMLRSPPEVDDEVSKMVIFQHFIRLRRIRSAQKDISHTLLISSRREKDNVSKVISHPGWLSSV